MLFKGTLRLQIFILFAFLTQICIAQGIRVIDNKGTLKIANNNRVTSSNTTPLLPLENDVWYDTSSTPTLIKIYNDGSWVNLSHTGTKGSVFFAATNGSPTENNGQLFWNSSNNRFGIGTNNPSQKLHVNGTMRTERILNSNGIVGGPSYSFNNDTNTGMFLSAADQLGFTTNGTEALRIDASQQVNIYNNLRVVGAYKDTSGDTGTIGQTLTSTGTGTNWTSELNSWSILGNSIASTNFIGTTNYQPFNIKVNNNSFGSFHPNGGISLGNTSVANENRAIAIGTGASANTIEAIAIGDSSNASNQQSIAIGKDTNVSGQRATGIGYQATTSQANAIVLGSSANNDNKVGIGTNTPDERLHIVGSIKIVDTTEGAGKILTSDASGKATWAPPANTYGQSYKASNSTISQYSAIPLGTTGEFQDLTIANDNIQTQELTGVYRITYTVSVEKTGDGTVFPQFYLTLHHAEIPNTRSYVFLRGNTDSPNIATVTRTVLVNITNTYRQIRIMASITETDVNILANGTSLLVEFVK